MENKPKTSSYKRLKPYIKGFQVPFVLAIVGAIISAVITVIGPDKLKEHCFNLGCFICHFSHCWLLTKFYRCNNYATIFTTFPYSNPKENQHRTS